MNMLMKTVLYTLLFLSNMGVYAGTDECYGYKSTTSHFACGEYGNCVWWAAYMRPDIARVITGSGWNGGDWYAKLKGTIPVGSVPEVGAIVEFEGHVAFVKDILDEGAFAVSEMDYYGQFGSGVQYATYTPNGDGTYQRNNESKKWTLNGFIYAEDPAVIPGNTFTVRRVGNYAWHPADSSCINAKNWYGLNSDRKIVRTYDDSQVCQWIYETLYPQEVSYNALFGNANACYQ
ncbi:MAG: CHAP domain-containing protein [Candidatus Moraniibacteriota bacterium]|nr:MAG: CHAP domain-containing protein [Candidatus Moranbacteria bacterium]